MATERVALVLGGGGMKGLAHVGVWRALREARVRVTEITGTSIGALVGACVAGGLDVESLTTAARTLQKPSIVTLNRWALLFNGIRQQSVFRGDVFQAYIASVLPVPEFSELWVPLSINAVDVATGEVVWFGAGGRSDVALSRAVYASCALPVFYPPAQIDGSYYIDGGVLDPLPILHALAQGADRVIAADVSAGPLADAGDTVEKGMVAIHHRTMQIMGHARKQELLAALDSDRVMYIRPNLGTYSTFDFENTEYFLAEGYRATAEALGLPERAAG